MYLFFDIYKSIFISIENIIFSTIIFFTIK